METSLRTGLPKNKLIHGFLRYPSLLKDITRPFTTKKFRIKLLDFLQKKNYDYTNKVMMNPETREKLKELFKENIVKLNELIDKDIIHWIE